RVFRNRFPLRAHVEQVHEEVVAQRLRPLGEDAVPGAADVRAQDAQAAQKRMAKHSAPGPDAQREGFDMARKLVDTAGKDFRGIYLMTPFAYFDMKGALTRNIKNRN
ncbi:MAG: hypothetical protein V1766_10410, partial [Pseudomonadota bacterium]